jgi:hypothetical protein
MTDHITVKGHDGTFAAHIARPKTPPAPAVVVLQELFGVNADNDAQGFLFGPLRKASEIDAFIARGSMQSLDAAVNNRNVRTLPVFGSMPLCTAAARA